LPGTTLVVRSATNADLDALVELGGTTFRETYHLTEDPADMDEYVTREFTAEVFSAILRDSNSTVLVASEDERLVGYAHLIDSPPPPCVTGPSPLELKRLYLRQDVIGKGYGKKLMHGVEQVARDRKRATMWLVVYSINEHARTFYKRWGFVDVGIKNFYFGGRAYPDPVMAKTIA
jgi:GNAT superfamily N-acetyltransferase